MASEIITVDPDLCVRCGLCVKDCPMGIIDQQGDAVPVCVADACIKCNHCVSICPTGALKLKWVKEESIVPKNESPATVEQVAALVRERRSVRQFRPERVPHSEIELLLQRATGAPTGGNSRSVKYALIETPAVLEEIRHLTTGALKKLLTSVPSLGAKLGSVLKACEAGKDVITRGAPHLLVAYGQGAQPRMVDVDLTIALETIELVASSMGLGTCWDGFVMLAFEMVPEFQALLEAHGVPKGCRMQVLMLGYPAVTYPRSVVRDVPPLVFI